MPLAGIDSGEKELFLSGSTAMRPEKAESGERWVALCAQAAVEQDPKKLLELVREINHLLDTRRKRLANERLANGDDGSDGHGPAGDGASDPRAIK